MGNGNWGIAELFDGSESCTTGPDEYINRVVKVPGEGIVLDTVCYNLCGLHFRFSNDTAYNYDDSANVDNGSCEYVAATELPNFGDDAGEGASWVCSSTATLKAPTTTSSWKSTTPPGMW